MELDRGPTAYQHVLEAEYPSTRDRGQTRGAQGGEERPSRILIHRLTHRQQEKETLDDLATELELTDEDQIVLYKIGESFHHLPQHRALKRLEKDQADIMTQLSALAATAEECEKGMKELKVVLYAKFGRAINLDE
ncbi:hypothetical protein J3R82DRAFT_11007 [Butyriboletus roseoflavus]|nr:hypothetical protein J3R82DRAFT_11007 [Butyriboletus roseoflavus]